MEISFESGEKLFFEKKYDKAVEIFEKLLEKEPENYLIISRLALIYHIKKEYDKAVKFYLKSLKINPKQVEIYNNLGCIYREINRFDKAIEFFKKDLSSYENLFNLGILFEKIGKIKEARKCYYNAIKLKIEKRFSLQTKIAFLLPPIYSSSNEILKVRRRIEDYINRHISSEEKIDNPIDDIGITNFYLGYHGMCNKDINVMIANFYRKNINSSFFKSFNKKPNNKKIKIGFVSSFFRKHSVSDVSNLWISQLNKKIFNTVIFSIGSFNDNSIKILKNNCNRFYSLPANIEIIQDAILSESLDILFFTDIGMDAVTYFLSFSRLAPIQVTYTGHPDTTGVDTIDYYISSDFWEINEAEKHYSEKLVKFHSLTWYYKKPEISDGLKKEKIDFGFSDKDNIYCINQSLFKIHPDFDAIIDKILEMDKNGKVVLFFNREFFWWKDFLVERFKNSIKNFNRVIFLPKLSFPLYLNFLSISNIILDTIYFNGGTTSLQAFAVGAPIVTMPDRLMRSRFTLGMYEKMGIDDLVSKSIDDYVEKAVKVANDKSINLELRKKIFKNNKCLYEDSEVIEEFENFFKNLI